MAMDILAAFQQEPPPIDFVWNGFLAGTVGALVSPGGTGKSLFALQTAIAIAGGPDFLDLNIQHTGRVVYLAAEDPEPIIARRLHAIGQYISKEKQEIVAENLIIEPIVGKRFNIMREDHLKQIIEICTDTRLLILDTISRMHTLDENSNSDMAGLISTLEYIAKQTETTVLFLHHTNKLAALAGLGDQQQAARGASAIIDNIRWCGFLCKMTKEEANVLADQKFGNIPISQIGEERRNFYLRFGVSKNNYAAPTEDKWFMREEGGMLVFTELKSIVDKKEKPDKKRYEH